LDFAGGEGAHTAATASSGSRLRIRGAIHRGFSTGARSIATSVFASLILAISSAD
jgi:hypothetical protein